MPEAEPQYYVYDGHGWTGPFVVAQIKDFLTDGQFAVETSIFEPEGQVKTTIGALLQLTEAEDPDRKTETRLTVISQPTVERLHERQSPGVVVPPGLLAVSGAIDMNESSPPLQQMYQS
ncbi:MAG: hypothetical protein H0W83_05835 [Planctomycetes bacterium]|nr:hypothetical protein [Planctomycetota bacterium]